MTRADLAAFLASNLAVLCAAAAYPATDTPDGMAYVLDSALTALGADLTTPDLTDAQQEPARALARYYGLVTLADPYALHVDTSLDAPAASRKDSQQGGGLERQIARAAARCKELGYPVGPDAAGALSLARINLDFLHSGGPARRDNWG